MDTKEGSVAGKAITDLTKKVEALQQMVDEFPLSAEEYTALEFKDRIKVARKILKVYANLPTHKDLRDAQKSAPASIPTDQEGVSFEGRAGYGPHFNQIVVHIRAKDDNTEISSKFQELPSIFLPDEIDGWESLESRTGKSIEVLDAVICELIEGKIAEQRRALGKSAIAKAHDTVPAAS